MFANRIPPLLPSLVALTLAACGAPQTETPSAPADSPAPEPVRAAAGETGSAELRNNAGQTIGAISLTQAPTGLLMRIEAEGLTPGWHGVHLHAVGDCSDEAFQSAGGHINHAEPVPHGLLNPEGPDDGDLPNIHADDRGRVRAEVFTSRARLAEAGPGQWLWDEDGSAVVIHANPDDHRSQPIGGAGDRVACAVVTRG